VPEKRDQGIFFNGSVKKRIVAVLIGDTLRLVLDRRIYRRDSRDLVLRVLFELGYSQI